MVLSRFVQKGAILKRAECSNREETDTKCRAQFIIVSRRLAMSVLFYLTVLLRGGAIEEGPKKLQNVAVVMTISAASTTLRDFRREDLFSARDLCSLRLTRKLCQWIWE